LGGGETSLVALLGSLDRERYAPVMICPREGPLTEAARALGVAVWVVPYRGASVWFLPGLWARLPAVGRLARCLRELEPAVAHSDFHTLPYAVPVCGRLEVPLVFTCYGWWFRPKAWQRRFYRTGPAAILAVSEAVKRGFLGRRPFMRADRVRVLPLGVDTERFRPRPAEREAIRRQLGLPLRAPVVTLLARFQDVKGHDVFLEAAELVATANPEARFAVAGQNVFGRSADEAFRRRVLSMAESSAVLRERVGFLGWVPRAEELLAASDVVVCSSHFESFGMAPIEAMACGVPVVSTNVGGTAETIVNGETGYLVPPRRPPAIAERVLALLADEELRSRLGRAGRARVMEDFALTRYAAGFSRVLEELAAPHG
jgi:glycosyltransferase involved in cell wall biosynthesis